MKKIKIELNSVTVGNQTRNIPHNMSNMRMHWAHKNRWKKAWQTEVETMVMVNRKKLGKLPLIKPKIIFEFFMLKPFDIDGAYNASKPLLDSLKVWKSKDNPGMGVIVEDDMDNVEFSVKPIKVKSKQEEKTIINIIIK